ncbi:MAG: DUF2382 domain-containing protein [Chloroflexi bacterium]|nr:DUF2382 domain-containing protein [Chloroflexota bacterium]
MRSEDLPGAPGDEAAAAVNVELHAEELRVDTEVVLVAVARLKRRVIAEVRTLEVEVRREEMSLERVPTAGLASAEVDAPVDLLAEDLAKLKPGESLRVPLIEEELVLTRHPIVRRELVISKRLIDDVHTVTETVRREDAHVAFVPVAGEKDPADSAPAPDSSRPVGAETEAASVDPAGSAPQRLELHEEGLRVQVEPREVGHVEVRTGVVQAQASVPVHLHHEEIVIVEETVDVRPAPSEPRASQEYVIAEYGERATVRKQPVVVEELTLTPRSLTEERILTTDLKHEELSVEWIPAQTREPESAVEEGPGLEPGQHDTRPSRVQRRQRKR